MANKIANTIYAVFKREEWEKVANIYAHNGYANQSYKEGDITLGRISKAQAVINTMDITRASKALGSTVEYGMKTVARSLDLVYIGLKNFGYSTNDKRLTIFNNQIK